MNERGNPILKLLDRNVGIPLVFVAGQLLKKRARPTEIASIGLFKDAAIGDMILISGVLQDLRRAFPRARLVIFSGSGLESIARLLPSADEIVPLPITSPLACVRTLRKHPVDVLLDFGQWSRIGALYSALARSSYRVGFRTAGQFRHYAYDAVADHLATRHELDNFRAIAEALGIGTAARPSIQPSSKEDSPVDGRYVVIHAWPSGTMSHLKEWPRERWGALARRILAERTKVVLTGSPADRDNSARLATEIGDSPNLIDLAGRIPFSKLPSLLAAADAVVSVNTGIMHLAAAIGAPTLSLNGPTSERRWGPVGARTASVSVAPPHGGYLNLGFEYAGQPQDSMQRIDVETVWAALNKLRHEPAARANQAQ